MPATQPITDWGDAIFLGITNSLNTLLAAIPAILGALVILLIGWLLSALVARLVTAALRRVGADRMFVEHGRETYGPGTMRYPPSMIGGEIAKWIIRLVFLTAAANALGMPQLSAFLNQVLLWVPNLIVAAVILLVAPLIGRFVRGAIETGAGEMGFTNAPLLGRLAQWAIIAFAVVIAINQVGIAASLVNALFIGLVAAIALATGLAFGLGGRDVAAEMTRGWYESSRVTAQRVRDRAREAATSTEPRRRESGLGAVASVRRSDVTPEQR